MSKNYTVMELEAIKHLCKCVNSVASLPADLISDTNVATNTTYSSYKIDAEMSALENDLDVLTTSFNNLVTSVDKKIDKDKIVTVLNDTVTDEQVASAKAVYDGLENINDFSVQVVKDNLNLNNITETGIYFFSRIYTPINTPTGANGWLLVMKGGYSDIVKQVWYSLDTENSNSYDTFERYNGGDTWSEWTKFLTETELKGSIEELISSNLGEKVDYKVVVENGTRYVEDIVTQDINTWLPNDNSSILINLKKTNGINYLNFQLLCNKKDSKNWSCIVNGAANELWKIRYIDGVRYIDELATMDKVADLTNVRKVFYGLNELNNAKGTNISLVVGEDNTIKIVDALSPIETFTDYFHNDINSNRFGIDANTYGAEISLLTITKFNDNVAVIRAYMSNGKLLVRRYRDGVLQDWSYDKGNSKDVAKTTITPVFPSGVVVASGGVAINYVVKNGWCNVNFAFNITSMTPFSWTDIATGLPKPANSVNITLMNEEGKINRTIAIKINSDGSVSSRVPMDYSTTDWWCGNISYPVAE